MYPTITSRRVSVRGSRQPTRIPRPVSVIFPQRNSPIKRKSLTSKITQQLNLRFKTIAAQNEDIAAARARQLAKSAALVKQRRAEREATLQIIEQERQERLQEARNKVEAERRRTAEARRKQHEAFQALHQRCRSDNQNLGSPSKMTHPFSNGSDAAVPRKLWDWQTRNAQKIESIRDIFSMTRAGHSRNFTPFPKRFQINKPFALLETELYLPPVPVVAADDLRWWQLNSADIDVSLRRFKSFESSLEVSVIAPWSERAKRSANKLPEHLYYSWRVCHNYGYFGWEVPRRTPRAFMQAMRYGWLDREWDETIAEREARVQAELERKGLEEKSSIVRVASGY
ncbi:hypothetical protein TWF694_003675 [Orbilia ellipsospora]|uniref:Uncharacterized protein n=1 Tax=Orbilia ellipsospora TaxID=2528407 RepID=A0AAV9WZ89_9PEZI